MQRSSFEIELFAWQFCSRSQMLKFWLPTSTNCCHLVLPTHILCYQYHIVGLGAELITEKRRLSLLKLWHDSTKLLFQPCAFPNSWHLRSRMHGWILLWWHDESKLPDKLCISICWSFISTKRILMLEGWSSGHYCNKHLCKYMCDLRISTWVCIES